MVRNQKRRAAPQKKRSLEALEHVALGSWRKKGCVIGGYSEACRAGRKINLKGQGGRGNVRRDENQTKGRVAKEMRRKGSSRTCPMGLSRKESEMDEAHWALAYMETSDKTSRNDSKSGNK